MSCCMFTTVICDESGVAPRQVQLRHGRSFLQTTRRSKRRVQAPISHVTIRVAGACVSPSEVCCRAIDG